MFRPDSNLGKRHTKRNSSNSDEVHIERDDGFILIVMGLLIIPLVAFTALAIDVSSWYSRATELQRAADAAALAGVVWMPQQSAADVNAKAVLDRNSFQNGTDNIVVTLAQGDEGPTSYKVCVTDSAAQQFFAAVFTSATSITRCGTAQYNLPLNVGSPLNFVGGYDNGWEQDPGHGPIDAIPPYGPATAPPGDNYSIDPDNFDSAQTSIPGASQYFDDNTGRYQDTLGCKARTNSSGTPRGYWWDSTGSRHGSTSNRLDNDRVGWRRTGSNWYHDVYADQLPDCIWTSPGEPAQPAQDPAWTIRPEMNPKFWLSVEAPGTDAVQGDRYSPKCYGVSVTSTSGCATSSPNPEYSENGYYYSLRINDSNPYLFLQVFDAQFRNRSNSSTETGERTLGNYAGAWTTHYEFLKPDLTPFDPTDNEAVGSGTCGGGSGNADFSGKWDLASNGSYSEFDGQWRTLCRLTNPVLTSNDSTYILRVWSSASGTGGNAANMYALRAVASDTTDLDKYNYPVDALGASEQPTFAPWQHMSIGVNISGSGAASFFFAEAGPQYAGKTLVMELYDAAEGATSITVNNPHGIQQGCSWSSSKLADVSGSNASGDGNSIGSGSTGSTLGNCTISTSGSRFNGRLLSIRIPIPTNYTCDATVRPKVIDTTDWNHGCWWTVTYNVSNAHDNTTWGAHIEGDPVRLVE